MVAAEQGQETIHICEKPSREAEGQYDTVDYAHQPAPFELCIGHAGRAHLVDVVMLITLKSHARELLPAIFGECLVAPMGFARICLQQRIVHSYHGIDRQCMLKVATCRTRSLVVDVRSDGFVHVDNGSIL